MAESSQNAHVVAAATYRGKETIVWLIGSRPSWPKRCACCFGAFEGERELDIGGGTTVTYPICSACRKHASRDTQLVLISAASAAVIVLSVFLTGWIPVLRRGFVLALLIGAVLFVAVATGIYKILGKTWGARGPGCPDGGWPVEKQTVEGLSAVLGTKNERTDERELRAFNENAVRSAGGKAWGLMLRNADYAGEFIRENGGDPSALARIEERM